MSELITDRSEVLRIIANEDDDAIQCRYNPNREWRGIDWYFLSLKDCFGQVDWRRTPKPVPPGDLTYEQARACIKRREPVQRWYGEWADSAANDNWDTELINDSAAYRRKPALKRVPLEAKDVPPGSVFRSNKCAYGAWVAPYAVTNVGVWFVRTNEWNYAALVDDWEIKRPGEDWQPCYKEI